MPRRMEHLDLGVPHVQDFAVLHAPERIVCFRTSEDYVLGSGRLGELTTARDMIGVHMRVDHVADRHVPLLRLLQITPDVSDGIDDGPDSLRRTPEKVGHGDDGISIQILTKKRVYPGFPTIFRGLSEFFVGDLMGKALWKLVGNAQRFPRRGGRVLCVHGPSASTGLVRVRQNGPRGGGLRTGPPASSDCGRPVNDKRSHQHRRSVQAERSSYPGKTVISGTYAIWETWI